MLRVRLRHVVLAVLLHVGVLVTWWWGTSAPDARQPAAAQPPAAAPGGQPLPQHLVASPPAAPPAAEAEAGKPAATSVPIAYAGSPASQPRGTPDLPQREAGEEQPVSPVGKIAGSAAPVGSIGYTTYVQEVLTPALGDAPLQGMQAPRYTVRLLSDGLIREMVQGGYARLVVKAREEFFLVEPSEGTLRFQRIAELPGYAQRALPLRTAFGQRVVQAIGSEYGYAAGAVTVLFMPSAPMDRLILTKQELAARQLNIPLAALVVTEGRIVPRGGAFSFLVEQVKVKDGRTLPFEDSERQFLEERR
jgi:hypothetical protein